MHLVEQSEGGGLELIGLFLELLGGGGTLTSLALGDKLTKRVNLLADLASLGLVEAVLEFLEGLLGIVQDRVSAVGSLNGGLALLVLLLVALGILNHVLDLRVRKTGAGSNGDGLILVGGLILGVDVDDRVGVNVEGDLNLRNTTVRRRNANELEVAEKLVVADELTLTLVDLDLNSRLEVGSGGEDLGLLGGDGGVAVDQTGENTAESLDTERKRGDVEKKDVSDLTGQNSTLDSSTNGNSLIGVDGLGGITAEDVLDRLSDLGHTGHTTDKDDILNVLGLEVGILQGLADGLNGAADEGINQALKLGTSELGVDVLGAGSVGSDEGKVDVGGERRGQLDLSLLSGLTDTLDGHAVVGEVNALLLLELLDEVADEGDIEILTTEVSVTVGGLDLKDTVLNLKNGDIESTTTKIVDSNDAVLLLLQTVSKSGRSGLVDDTEDVQTRDLTGILSSLTLRVVEVGGDGDDGVLDVLAKISFGGLLHLAENEATDLRRRVLLALGLEPSIAVAVLDDLVRDLGNITLNLGVGKLASDQTLSGEESVLGVDNGLALGGNTDETLAVLGESDDGRSSTGTCGANVSKIDCEGLRDPIENIPSEFSMMRGCLPSITATAELVVPRSIPMTWPLTFSVDSSA